MRSALAGGDSSVMTIDTRVCSLSVIKRHDDRYPHISGMTGIALFTGHGMSGRFVGARTHPVMTTGTVACLPGHGGVIKQDLQPIGGVMAYIAGLGGRNMGSPFAGGNRAIMTVLTHIRGLTVIDGNYV